MAFQHYIRKKKIANVVDQNKEMTKKESSWCIAATYYYLSNIKHKS